MGAGDSQKSKFLAPDVLHKLQEKAGPLLTWLKTAQEESDSEEDADEEVQFQSEKSSKPAEPMYAHLAQPVKSAEVGTRGAEELEASDDEKQNHRTSAASKAPASALAPTSAEIDIDAI